MLSDPSENTTESFLIDLDKKPSRGTNKIKENPKLKTRRHFVLKHVEFEQYIRDNCENKIKILNRETFHQILRPILIVFNHFHMKCAYHTKWLDMLYELATKYGDYIELIAADIIDMEIMYPNSNPMNFFACITRPEEKSSIIFAIDEKKRTLRRFDANMTLETLTVICEDLLNDKLFPSLPVTESNIGKLVKICVHLNYDDLVLKSNKNILLIIDLSYAPEACRTEPDYEKVASVLKDYNLDIVYLQAEKNYVPFEFGTLTYPCLIYLPSNDKNNFIFYENYRSEDLIIQFLKNVITNPEYLHLKQKQQRLRNQGKIVEVTNDFLLDFDDLNDFLYQHYDEKITLFDRKMITNIKHTILIAFFDFQGKCLPHHVQWLDKIFQVVENSFSLKFFIADFKDIDIINSRWQAKDLVKASSGKPKIYAIDSFNLKYEMTDFNTLPSLFYFMCALENGDLFYTQTLPKNKAGEMVKVWTAQYFYKLLKNAKKHIFITFYNSDDTESEKICKLLELLAHDVKDLNVDVVKYDVSQNYTSLEYAQAIYPSYYFISQNNKNDCRLYVDKDLNINNVVEFIKNNTDK